MKRWLEIVFALWLALAASSAFAAPAAVVESVQMPAWVERAGKQRPASPGTELIATDTLRTGAGARLYIKLAEGSTVKLGENASLQLLDLVPERGGLFRATLNVIAGAFRFTTEAVAKPRPRDVKLRISTVTAGIRGTDLWGRSVRDNEIVCLIEGAIEVGAESEKPVRMDQPRQFYQRDKGRTQPLSVITPEKLAELARETEIETGKGAARRGGKWKVTLANAMRPRPGRRQSARTSCGSRNCRRRRRPKRWRRGFAASTEWAIRRCRTEGPSAAREGAFTRVR